MRFCCRGLWCFNGGTAGSVRCSDSRRLSEQPGAPTNPRRYRARGLAGGHGLLRWRFFCCGQSAAFCLFPVFSTKLSCAMSLIPSKRVDRIFPVVPPLCLLLASQINHRVGALRRLPEAFGTARRSYLGIALVSAILFTGGYTISKVVAGYRDHRDALAVFGRKVRHEAEARQWRCEVVSAKDEGLLLYLRRTQFIEPDRALAEWNRENIDALVVSTEKAPAVMPQLQGAAVSQLKSNQARDGRQTGYVLITR